MKIQRALKKALIKKLNNHMKKHKLQNLSKNAGVNEVKHLCIAFKTTATPFDFSPMTHKAI
jgi:hypothetical protein